MHLNHWFRNNWFDRW